MKELSAFVLIITSQNGVCEIIDYRFVHLYSILHIRIENISAYIIYTIYVKFVFFCFVEVCFFGLFKRIFHLCHVFHMLHRNSAP